MDAGTKALSKQDIEKYFENLDRVTLYRTLITFERKGLIHQAMDGSGTAKYALCAEACTEHQHHDEHAHFHCFACGETICLEGNISPQVTVPKGYVIRQAHLVLEGRCEACS